MIGLVIVNYNDYKNSIKFLESISTFDSIKHVVIVDNCSTDDSFDRLKKVCNNKVSLIKNVSNKGYGSGINLGSKFLIDNYGVEKIIVSNTDIIIDSDDDIVCLCDYLKDDVALVGPNVLEKGGINRGWKLPSTFDDVIFNLPIIYNKMMKKLIFYSDDCYKNNITQVEALSGCFFIVRADALIDVDFFDEGIFLYYEENVLGYKLKKKGYKSLIVNDVKVIHNHSVTIDNSLSKIRKYKALKKSQRFYHKNYSKCSFIGMFFLYVTYYFKLMTLYISGFFRK